MLHDKQKVSISSIFISHRSVSVCILYKHHSKIDILLKFTSLDKVDLTAGTFLGRSTEQKNSTFNQILFHQCLDTESTSKTLNGDEVVTTSMSNTTNTSGMSFPSYIPIEHLINLFLPGQSIIFTNETNTSSRGAVGELGHKSSFQTNSI